MSGSDMFPELAHTITLPDTRVLIESLRGEVCPACGKRKTAKQTLCRTCYLALRQPQRQALYRLVGDGYEQAVLNAMKQLRAFKAHWPKPSEESDHVV